MHVDVTADHMGSSRTSYIQGERENNRLIASLYHWQDCILTNCEILSDAATYVGNKLFCQIKY